MLLLFASSCWNSDPVLGTTAPTSDSGALAGEPSDDENRLANPGFELGESWWRPAGYANHAWLKRGDPLGSGALEPAEGEHAQRIWGFYGGSVPNESEHGLTLGDLTPGDTHVVTAQVLTPAGDAVSGNSSAVLFLRFTGADGAVLGEEVSAAVDAASEADVWEPLVVQATVPEGAVGGALGVRFALADWGDTGSVVLDDVSWTSTGTGQVVGERLLVWNDEFDGDALDEDRWTRLELPAYTFNNEVQRYTTSTDNADVVDGELVITAKYASDGSVTSARLVTDGKGDWTYGRIEAFARVPDGVGTWPAFWMLPTDRAYGGWPDSGEIDILEHVGCSYGSLYQTVHTGAYNHLLGTQQGGETWRDTAGAMYLYAVDWTEDEMVFTVDGEPVFVFRNDGAGDAATWPFDQRFHVILNLAFGGDWGGWCGVDWGALPQTFHVDWVRVYQ